MKDCFTFQTTICSRVSTQMPLCPLVWRMNWLVMHERRKKKKPSTHLSVTLHVLPPASPVSWTQHNKSPQWL